MIDLTDSQVIFLIALLENSLSDLTKEEHIKTEKIIYEIKMQYTMDKISKS